MKVLSISLPPWKWGGVVVQGGDPEAFKAYVRRQFDVEVSVGPQSMGHGAVFDGKPWMIWVESIEDLPSLAHEAFHVVSGVLEARGLKHTADSEEAFTYTLEFLLRAALQKKGWRVVR